MFYFVIVSSSSLLLLVPVQGCVTMAFRGNFFFIFCVRLHIILYVSENNIGCVWKHRETLGILVYLFKNIKAYFYSKWTYEPRHTIRFLWAYVNSEGPESNQGDHCLLLELFDTIDCIDGEHMPGWDVVHASDVFESMHFPYASRPVVCSVQRDWN